jgi:hypothetical protein
MAKTIKLCYNLSIYEAYYYSIIYNDFSVKYNIPWEVYPAVTRVESNFNPTLLSDENAKGIVQVLDITAKIISKKIGIQYKDYTLWSEVLCQVIGFTYLSEAIQKGGIEDGIRSYVEGPDGKNCKEAKKYKRDVKSERMILKKKMAKVKQDEEDKEKTAQAQAEFNILSYVYKGIERDSFPLNIHKTEVIIKNKQ